MRAPSNRERLFMRLRPLAASFAGIILGATAAHAAPTYLWSHRYVQTDDQYVNKIAVDVAGNVIMCGDFYTALKLGTTYPSAGFEDGFVAKFDPNGNLLWVHQLGDVRPDRAWDVTTDLVGNVIVVGHMSAGMNDQDAIIAKYAPDGTEKWFKRFGAGDMHYQTAISVSVNLSKEIFVAGEFDGAFSLGGATLQPTGGVTFFLAKFDQNGNHLWSKALLTRTPYAYNLSGLATGSDGQTTFTGVLLDSLDLGNGVLTSAGSYDIFLGRFDTDGNALWSKRFGDAQDQIVQALAINGTNQIALAAATNGSVNFGGGTLTAAGDYEPVIAVLNASGNHVWSKIYNGSSNQYATSLTWASNNDLLVVCRGTGTLDFGGGPRTIAGPISGVWLTRLYGTSGTHRWSTTYVASGGMDAQIEENSGHLFMAGGVGGSIDFGGGQTTGEPDYDDLYLARFGDALTNVPSRISVTQLGQNIPNPFNPTTSIPFTLPASARVRINVYSTSGALVTTLDAGVQPAGTHSITWNGRDARGQSVASGVYFYRLEGSAEAPRKMLLLK
jgi:hypothetical protein